MYLKLFATTICLLLLSCKTTETGTPDKKDDEFKNLAKLTLIDFLRNQPGVAITGNGNAYQVLIRGKKSFQGDNDPLYVLDGVPIGRSYNDAASIVDVTQIESVKIVPPPRAGRYGSRGQNGVIEIETKTKI